MPTIVVTALDPFLQSHADALAQKLNISCAPPGSPQADWQLQFRPIEGSERFRLELQKLGNSAPGPITVDFIGGRVGHRRRSGEGRKQPLARAAGLKHGANPTVIDATGGLGRDGFVLAMLGCTVTLIERNPVIAALLDDGLRRARLDADTAPIAARLALRHADARTVLDALTGPEQPDVIYLDPMYPQRDKTAAVKKEMSALQELLGPDDDAAQLLPLARRRARQRVVVKRPKSAPDLGNTPPHHRIVTPNTRYDVYLAGSPPV